MKMQKLPKIPAVGSKAVKDIFCNPVIITEKIDGSQFSFYKTVAGEIVCRSKNQVLPLENAGKLFAPAVKAVMERKDDIHSGIIFFGETLSKPKHNRIKYDRVPAGHVILFGAYFVDSATWMHPDSLPSYAKHLGFETVPILFEGMLSVLLAPLSAQLDTLIKSNVPVLGGEMIEGVVINNLYRPSTLPDGTLSPYMIAKYVQQAFKEKANQPSDKKKRESLTNWQDFCSAHRTEARWHKAIQHLAEQGLLAEDPRDIGQLIKEIQKDIIEEEKESILDFLWKTFSPQLLKASIDGFPEFYKKYLMEN